MARSALKEGFLKLLKEDAEFRQVVAGIIGYGDILRKLSEHDRKFNEILEELKRHREILEEHTRILEEHGKVLGEHTKILEEHTRILEEHTKRLGEHDRKFNEILEELRKHREILEEHTRILEEHTKRLGEHDRKFNEILEELKRHREVLEEHTKRLEKHDVKFNEVVRELRELKRDVRELRAYIERTSLTLEEEAREVIAYRLREKGIMVELTDLVLPGVEVNVYGCSGDICVVGEVSTRAGVSVVRRLDELVNSLLKAYPTYLRPRVIKALYTLWVTPKAVEEARERGIWLVKALKELTPLTYVSTNNSNV
ncbi:MAG: hypothetical protein B6U73_02610 [Desulfurococcales archaeon ex4484_204]|nr:MAG: hypothetical protein B6U73_02610 [Desulfurococcales archaeon ex4484_204]